jgi:hypothetical protein
MVYSPKQKYVCNMKQGERTLILRLLLIDSMMALVTTIVVLLYCVINHVTETYERLYLSSLFTL